MERTKLLTITVIGLLLLNLATLGFLVLNGPKPDRMPPGERKLPKEIIIERLGFDAKQQEQYAVLIRSHREEIDHLDKEIRHKKYLLYSFLQKDTTQSDFKSGKQRIMDNLSSLQQQVEATHYKHFQDIKSICKPDQLKAFDRLIVDLPKLFGPKPPRPRHE